MKRPHGKVIGTAVEDRELFFEIHQRVEGMTGIEPLLVLAVTSFHLTIVPRRVRPDELKHWRAYTNPEDPEERGKVMQDGRRFDAYGYSGEV